MENLNEYIANFDKGNEEITKYFDELLAKTKAQVKDEKLLYILASIEVRLAELFHRQYAIIYGLKNIAKQ